MSARSIWRRPWPYIAALALLLLGFLAATGGDLTKLDWRHVPRRAGWQLPDRVIAALSLRPGDKVADIGAGRGYFTFRLAEAVGPDGVVYAVEVKDRLVEELKAKSRATGQANVLAVRGRLDDPLLPDGQIDLIFLCNTYHHIDNRVDYFDRLRRDLSPRGRLAVVDLKGGWLSRVLMPAGHWTAVETMEQEMHLAHYRRVASFHFLPLQSFLIFAPAGGPDLERTR